MSSLHRGTRKLWRSIVALKSSRGVKQSTLLIRAMAYFSIIRYSEHNTMPDIRSYDVSNPRSCNDVDSSCVWSGSKRNENDGNFSNNHLGCKFILRISSKFNSSFITGLINIQSSRARFNLFYNLLQFQTQQVYCVRDRNGAVTEGGKVRQNPSFSLFSQWGNWWMLSISFRWGKKSLLNSFFRALIQKTWLLTFVAEQDTIHTVYYAWAMQQIDPEELGEGAMYPVWRLREMQQIGVRALI